TQQCLELAQPNLQWQPRLRWNQLQHLNCSFIRARPLAKKTASLINDRNFQKQNLDFGMRILDLRYSVYFKLIERSDSIIRHSSFAIRHSNVVS
ncbi:hypothetical protein D1AOALGA4SA_12222, partial [Olavius algarvensis Delta 1 endosymbiont]